MILITGHMGVIGSKLWATFPEDKVVGIDLKENKDLLTVDLPSNIDYVFHLASQTSVERSWEDPAHDMDNIKMTARLVKHYPNTKIIYAGSAAGTESPKSPYGFSKKASADYLKLFHPNYVICTFPNVYGTGKSVVDIFKASDKVTIFGDGLQTRDYVHVDDIVRGLRMAMGWESGEYFMGSTKATTVLELAEGKEVTYAPARKEERESVLSNNCPIWKPKIKVKEYLWQK